MEITVFLHNKTSNWWQGVRSIKYVTWSRSGSELTEIYNNNEAPSQKSEIRFDNINKKLYITPWSSNMVVDIFILKLPATIIRS